MLSWDDYDNNTEETAVVNEAALQQLKTAEQPAPAAYRRAPLHLLVLNPRRRHQRRLF